MTSRSARRTSARPRRRTSGEADELRALHQENAALRRRLAAAEERAATLFETSPIPKVIYDEDTLRITDANAATCEVLGWTRDELRGRRLTDLASAKSLAEFKRLIDKGLPGRFEAEWVVRARSGEERTLQLASQRIDADGARLRLVSGNDVTQRCLAERALRRSEELFRAVTEHSSEAISIIDAEGTIRYVSPVIRSMLGFEPEELIGVNPSGLTHPDDLARVTEAFAQLRAVPGASGLLRYRLRHKNGQWRWVEVARRNLLDHPAVRGFVGNLRDVTAGAEDEEAVRYQAALLEAVDQAIIATDAAGRVTYWNQFAERLFGCTSTQAMGCPIEEVVRPATLETMALDLGARVARGEHWQCELATLHAEGTERVCHGSLSPLYDGAGKRVGMLIVARDLTEQRALEAQLRQAQKMEAVGRLAGGVAHDFNNLLTVILASSELLLADLRAEDPMRAEVEEINLATMRAASLTRQLLAFSRRQVTQPRAVDLEDTLRGLERMLTRLLGEDIRYESEGGDALWPVFVDPGQIEQVIVNLAVNSRDAMPEGGTLRVRATNVSLAGTASAAPEGGVPLAHHEEDQIVGDYVLLELTDSGVGMSADTLEHLFEPFFTTKAPGQGTGLGLSTVDGIVRQAGGHIVVSSQRGVGTTFRIYLPRHTGDPDGAADGPAESTFPSAIGGAVLVLEDDLSVRAAVSRALSRLGYEVVLADGLAQAVEVVARRGPEIRLLLSDYVMPELNGRQLAERLAEVGLRAPVLFMSGYTDDALMRAGSLPRGMSFLQKPFTIPVLAQRVREAIRGAPA